MTTVRQADGYARSVLVAAFLSVAGILASQFTTAPAFLLDPTLAEAPTEASNASTFLLLSLNFLGFVLVGGLYLWRTGRSREWLDLRWPTGREWLYVLVGVVGSVAFVMAVNLVATLLSLPSSENQVISMIGDDPNMVLLLIVVVFLFNAPAEEFLFRNVVQKRLYAAFSRTGAVVVASAIFALVHIPSYALTLDGSTPPLAAVAVSLTVVFGGSLIFGFLYARTDNLVVPTAAHAAFNAFQFAILYLALRFAPEEFDGAFAATVELAAALIPV